VLPWTSQIDTTHTASTTVTPLFVTSRAGGAQETMVFLDPSRPFQPRQPAPAARGAAREQGGIRYAKGAPRGRLVVVGTSDFASDRYARNSPENVVFRRECDRLAGTGRGADRHSLQEPRPAAARVHERRHARRRQVRNLIGVPVC